MSEDRIDIVPPVRLTLRTWIMLLGMFAMALYWLFNVQTTLQSLDKRLEDSRRERIETDKAHADRMNAQDQRVIGLQTQLLLLQQRFDKGHAVVPTMPP